MRKFLILLPFALLPLGACDQVNQKLGLEDPAKKEARMEAEGKAVGSACRQSGRAIEDCYSIYSWLPKAAIYAGWLEMDGYMRDNKIETVEPQLPPPEPPGKKRKVVAPEGEEDEKATAKSRDKKGETADEKAPEKDAGKDADKGTDTHAEKDGEKPPAKH